MRESGGVMRDLDDLCANQKGYTRLSKKLTIHIAETTKLTPKKNQIPKLRAKVESPRHTTTNQTAQNKKRISRKRDARIYVNLRKND